VNDLRKQKFKKEELVMSAQFRFFGFVPDYDLKKNANSLLARLIDLSPYGTVSVALIEKTAEGFRCAIDLYTQHGPFIACSFRKTASEALNHVCEELHKKLKCLREMRVRNLQKDDQKEVSQKVSSRVPEFRDLTRKTSIPFFNL
jgi:hypothetical protein